ncbi:MAG: CRISPR-associated ring nuclease Csm6 [Rhodocyclaceae bacterium]|nr:CRISPR-associated ring nuclease Csm6 [Rhodocyclaceae bacterium]
MTTLSLPSNPMRRILLCVTGLSPQIVTETLYALAVNPPAGRAPWVPDEVRVITTSRGADNVRLALLHPAQGWFHRLREDYSLPPIAFDEQQHIHLIRRPDGSALDDIRDDVDNALAGDAILALVQQLTREPTTEIHASIAGGRKTMGFFLGYAMSLYGRPQDRLSHVLVSEPYESNRAFFYPTPQSHPIPRSREGVEMIDAAAAHVWLGDIPFVRLRSILGEEELLRSDLAFTEAVARVQESLTPQRISIDLTARAVIVGGQVIRLRPTVLSFLVWVIERQRDERPVRRRARMEEALRDRDEYLRIYRRYQPDADEQTRTVQRLKEGMEPNFLSECASRFKEALERALGKAKAQPYLIRAEGKRSAGVYRIATPLEQIEILTGRHR